MRIKFSINGAVDYSDETFPKLDNLEEHVRTTLTEMLTRRVFAGSIQTRLDLTVSIHPSIKQAEVTP